MSTRSFPKIPTCVFVLAAFLCPAMVAVSPLHAGFQCTPDNSGTYVYRVTGEVFDTTTSQFNPPGPFVGIGVFTVNAEGTITKLIEHRMQPGGPSPLNGVDLAQIFDIQLTNSPDCTTKTVFTDRATGETALEFRGNQANGKQEGWAIQTFPPDRLSLLTVKKVDPFVDSDRVDQIASRLGILILQDDD